jgi:hypothetical protein
VPREECRPPIVRAPSDRRLEGARLPPGGCNPDVERVVFGFRPVLREVLAHQRKRSEVEFLREPAVIGQVADVRGDEHALGTAPENDIGGGELPIHQLGPVGVGFRVAPAARQAVNAEPAVGMCFAQ